MSHSRDFSIQESQNRTTGKQALQPTVSLPPIKYLFALFQFGSTKSLAIYALAIQGIIKIYIIWCESICLHHPLRQCAPDLAYGADNKIFPRFPLNLLLSSKSMHAHLDIIVIGIGVSLSMPLNAIQSITDQIWTGLIKKDYVI